MPVTDGAWKFDASKARASDRSGPNPSSSSTRPSAPTEAGRTWPRARREQKRAPMPSGPSSHFCAGSARKSTSRSSTSSAIAPTDWAPSSATRAPAWWAIRASLGRAVAGRSTSRRARRAPVGDDRRAPLDRVHRRVVVDRRDVHDSDLDPSPLGQVAHRGDHGRIFQARRHEPIAGSPVDRPEGRVDAVGRAVGQRHRVDVGVDDRGDARPRLVEPHERVLEIRLVGPAGGELPLGKLRHGGCRFARDGPGRAGVQIDAGARRGQSLADGHQLGVVRHEGADHGFRMIPAMPQRPAQTDPCHGPCPMAAVAGGGKPAARGPAAP